ncbi:MAG: energy-coupling factor transporter transmembrane protein EcfT [Clostridia bacterium]|nr:energy-coupling factor transporter transmembrane protein EcfT [Clostridia bacterium]
MKGLLEYCRGNSFLHSCNPLIKIAAAFIMCVGCFMCSSLIYVLCVIGITLIAGYSAGVGGKVLKIFTSLLKLGFILLLLQIFFISEGHVLISLPFGIRVTAEGLHFCVLLALRIAGATLPLALMLMVTKMSDISGALVKKLHVPYKYAFAITTALRFIPVFADEMNGIIEAQTARGVEFDTKNPIKKISLMLPLCVPLLVSSVKRIEDSSTSALLRGFSLRTYKSGVKTYPFHLRDAALLSVAAVTSACGLLIGILI